MSHVDDDRLLAYVLEVLERDSEHDQIAEHLACCAACRARLEQARGEIEIMSSVRPYGRVLRIPDPKIRGWRMYAALRATAMIALGIFMGFGASSLLHHRPTEVVPPYLVLSPPADCSSGCAVTDVTEIPLQYYKDLIGKQR